MKTNHEYLADQAKYTGFGTLVEIPIADAIAKNGESFAVPFHGDFKGKEYDAILNFKKSEKTGNYFFQSYSLSLEREGHSLQHTFYINNKPFDRNQAENVPRNFTLKEAFNLLEGRPVLKTMEYEGEVSTRWRTLQIFEEDGNGGLKLAKGEDQKNFKMKSYPEDWVKLDVAVRNLNPKELERPASFQERIRSLERGNITRFTIVSGQNEYPRDIEVSMKFRTLLMNIPPKGKGKESVLEHGQAGEAVGEQKQLNNPGGNTQRTVNAAKDVQAVPPPRTTVRTAPKAKASPANGRAVKGRKANTEVVKGAAKTKKAGKAV